MQELCRLPSNVHEEAAQGNYPGKSGGSCLAESSALGFTLRLGVASSQARGVYSL